MGLRALSIPAALGIALAAPALAQVTTQVLPFAPHGDTIYEVAGAPLPLTVDSVLVSLLGPDGNATTADDVTLLVRDLDGTPSITAIPTPYLSSYSPRMERLSTTRVLLANAGPDATFQTGDDGVYLLDDLGGANTVTPINTGSVDTGDGFRPTRLDANTAVVATGGPDLAQGTADDTLALLTDLGGTNTVTQLAASGLSIIGNTRPAALSPTSFLVATGGPDGSDGNADDETLLFTDVGGANTRTPLATPFVGTRAMGTAVRLGATRALVVSMGGDAAPTTADDAVLLLDSLGTTNTVTPIPVPNITRQGSSVPVAIDEATAILGTEGPDSTEGTADDAYALLTDLGGTPQVQSIAAPGLSWDLSGRPVRIGPGVFAAASQGVDGLPNTPDDSVLVLSDVGGANSTTSIPLAGLADRATGRIEPLGPTGLLVTSGGADGMTTFGSADDLTWIQDLVGAPTLQAIPAGVHDEVYNFGQSPQSLGNGLAVLLDIGADASTGSGGDDGLRVISGLTGAVTFAAQKITVKFDTAKPEKGEKLSAKAELLLPEDRFTESDLTVRVGNASQTIPAASFVLKKNKWTYKDKKGVNGFLRKVTWHPTKGKLQVKGKGVMTGAETTDVANVVLSLESSALYAAEAVAGEVKKKKIVYKAPK